ncbi:MAG: hypothetical protein M3Q56_00610 [Bacteroidota bacterium]|nr:hypothetical protein [Bacteroidota bacterium]
MKIIITMILSVLIADSVISQNQDIAKLYADSAVKMFNWDVEKHDRGAIMFLDVAYRQDDQDSVEYLTLTVAKDKAQKRPEFISIIVPNNIIQSNGIFIKFENTAKSKKGKLHPELEKRNLVRVHFEECNDEDEICTARIFGSYVMNEETNEKIDIFKKMMDYAHVYFLFNYPNESHKSISVPLTAFKKQYKSL